MYHQKCNATLSFKVLHEYNLVFVDVLNREGVALTFFGIKADRDSLHGTDIIHSGTLLKIGQGNLVFGMVNLDWFNRGRDFLN